MAGNVARPLIDSRSRVSVADNHPIQRWSTDAVEMPRRLEYLAAALSESVFPVRVDSADVTRFHGQIATAQLGDIVVTEAVGSARRALRGPAEIARSARHSFNLIVSLKQPLTVDCSGAMRMLPRDVLLFDSERPIAVDFCDDYTAVTISVSELWLRQWLPDPHVLVGRPIAGNSLWGHALSSYLCDLTPELAANSLLPLSVMSDQVGALLALTSDAVRSKAVAPAQGMLSLLQRIDDCIDQRCTEPELTAADVAASVGVSLRTLHRTFAACNATFGQRLVDARVRVALRILKAPLFRRVTTAEISRRAGFLSASHFARVIRLQTGQTPAQIRRAFTGT
jgi:AraC family transcriptional activator of tynA and feaB